MRALSIVLVSLLLLFGEPARSETPIPEIFEEPDPRAPLILSDDIVVNADTETSLISVATPDNGGWGDMVTILVREMKDPTAHLRIGPMDKAPELVCPISRTKFSDPRMIGFSLKLTKRAARHAWVRINDFETNGRKSYWVALGSFWK